MSLRVLDIVIPRDFFNLAKVYKCYGFLSLAIHNGVDSAKNDCTHLKIVEPSSTWSPVVFQQDADGALVVLPCRFMSNNTHVPLFNRYNDKSEFTMYALDENFEEINVFSERNDGSLSSDFIRFTKNLP